ncbi:MAG: hypothetical protein J1E41_00830, partial [Ruminococcus sp.]|nr:hypothetical protein [Ruminococcus sp.]
FPVYDANGTVKNYREGSKNDGNVSYIDFTTQVNSPDADIEFWFKSRPTIYGHNEKGETEEIKNARYAITVDGETYIYSSDGTAKTLNSSNVETAVSGVRKTSVYTYGNPENTTDENGYNSNFLFSVKKGDTVNLNIKIWLEGGFSTDITASDINLSLVSSWAYTRTLTVVDRTTGAGAASWIKNNNAKLYLVLPDVLNELSTNVGNWSNYTDAFYPMTLASGSSDTYKVTDVPLVYNNVKMMIFRCTDRGWNQSSSSSGGDSAKQRGDDYKVYCWNWWSSYLPNTYRDETYTIYGSSYDDVATGQFGGEQTNKGYGTWGEVLEIKVNPRYDGMNFASTTNVGNYNFFLRDFTDYDTSGEIYTYTMYWDSGAGLWKAYAPKSSTLIHFYYYNDSCKRWWGYNSWGGANPQMRPEDSTTYYLTGIANGSGNSDGYGYWDGANNVYLIASGTMKGQATKRCNMYTSSTGSIKQMSKTGETYGANSYNVYVSDSSQKAGDYKNLKFDNGSYGYGNESAELTMYPGCYYDWEEDKWRGSLSGTQRSSAESSGGGSGGGSSGGSSGDITGSGDGSTITNKMDGPGVYLYGKLDGVNTDQICKMTELSSGRFQAKLNLTEGDRYKYYFMIREASSSSTWNEYGGSLNYKELSQNMGTEEYNLSSSNSQPLYLYVKNAGTYIFTYTTNDHKIAITK